MRWHLISCSHLKILTFPHVVSTGYTTEAATASRDLRRVGRMTWRKAFVATNWRTCGVPLQRLRWGQPCMEP